MPAAVFTGEHFPVDLTILSPSATSATVELSAEGKAIGTHKISLVAGENRIRMRTSLNASGAVDLSGKVEAAGLGESRFENAISVHRPKVQWISEDPPGTEGHILEVLAANRFDVVESKTLPANLDDTQLVVFNNINMETMRPADKQRAVDFVQSGGGALWIAGEHNVYVDHKDAPEDPLALAFPAKLVPPRSPQGTAVVLIIDKSSSMEGKKIELARAAAEGVVDNLKADDHVGVLIFDNSFMWDVPIRTADNKTLIKREISGIMPDGGTQIAPALTEAYQRILGVNAAFKHIVLLTDGISEEGDSVGLAKQAATNRVTISTVGLGQDVNRAYLEKIATGAKGKAYLLSEPTGLEQILLKDVQEHTGTTAVEKPIKPEVKHPSDLLDKVEMDKAPNLSGYVRFEARPTADEILAVDATDPLLVRWQYGLGRATVFSSDAKSRWAAEWLGWQGFDRLWTNIFRDLLPHGTDSEAAARYDGANEELVVDYHLSERSAETVTAPDLFVLGPENFRRPLDLTRLSPGTYRGRVKIGSLSGLFRVRPLNDSRAFPEVGLYRQESELSDFGSNQALLKSIADSTGGRFNPSVKQLLDSGGRYTDSTMRLWPGLLGLAILLNLIELASRKWKGIVESLRGGVLPRLPRWCSCCFRWPGFAPIRAFRRWSISAATMARPFLLCSRRCHRRLRLASRGARGGQVALDARRPTENAAGGADHAPCVRRGLEPGRPVERRSAEGLSAARWRGPPRGLRQLHMLRRLFIQHRHGERTAPADHPGARLRARGAVVDLGRAFAAAHPDQAWLQEPKIYPGNRGDPHQSRGLLGEAGLRLVQRTVILLLVAAEHLPWQVEQVYPP